MFDKSCKKVALIKKSKPQWQLGKLNGIGGKIEKNETAYQAMIREFEEETGVTCQHWNEFCTMKSPSWVVFCFASNGRLSDLKSMTNEQVKVIQLKNLKKAKIIGNLHWLLPLALSGERIEARYRFFEW